VGRVVLRICKLRDSSLSEVGKWCADHSTCGRTNISFHSAEVVNGTTFWLENSFVRACVESDGRISSFYERETQREYIVQGEFGNKFKYFEDIPLFWDAWGEFYVELVRLMLLIYLPLLLDVEIYHLEKHWDAGTGVAKVGLR